MHLHFKKTEHTKNVLDYNKVCLYLLSIYYGQFYRFSDTLRKISQIDTVTNRYFVFIYPFVAVFLQEYCNTFAGISQYSYKNTVDNFIGFILHCMLVVRKSTLCKVDYIICKTHKQTYFNSYQDSFIGFATPSHTFDNFTDSFIGF